ncbi:sensor histidine kinase [Tessaracoccus sp. Z1128]
MTWAIVHDVVLVLLHWDHVAGVPSPTTSVLLLIPVMYAALNFGVRGGIGIALWATALVVPHWFLSPQFSAAHVWVEVGYLVVLYAVAVVVGQRVEREQRARQNAEAALTSARRAEARYYTLFEDQPAPVLISDLSGRLVEANTAAKRLLGTVVPRGNVAELLGVDLEVLLQGNRSFLTLTTGGNGEVLLMPTAHRLEDADGTAMVQIVLTDITEQHRRQEEQRTLDDLTERTPRADEMRRRLAQSAVVADDATVSLRKIIQGLRPPVLDDLALVSALRQLTEETRSRSDAIVRLEVTGEAGRLNPDLELAAYRIAQEALNNVVRHAHAKHATVSLCFADESLRLTVSDDGRGIASTGPRAGPRVAWDSSACASGSTWPGGRSPSPRCGRTALGCRPLSR